MLQPGERFGVYTIVAPLAAGGMGVVYRARHATLGHPVAIKALLSNLALQENVRRRFAQEAWVQAQLQHPGVVRIVDFVQTGHVHAIVMELVEGCSLEHVLTEEAPGGWSLDATMRLLRPVVSAMAYAHARKVVHRDLKPANVLMDRRGGAPWPGMPKITDFGLARVMESTGGMTRQGTRMGTIPYMPPEQFGGRAVDARADVFALGMLARRLVTGTLPVDPDDMMAAGMLYTGQAPMPSLHALVPSLPRPFVAAVDAALSLDPAGRPASAGELHEALGFGSPELGGGRSIETHAPSGWGAPVPSISAQSSDASLPVEPAVVPSLAPPVEASSDPETAPTESPGRALPTTPSSAASDVASTPLPSLSAPPSPAPVRRKPTAGGASGWIWAGAGLVALGVVGAGVAILQTAAEERARVAEEQAREAAVKAEHERLIQTAWQSLERFKTDHEANRDSGLVDAAVVASATAVELQATPEALGLHALSTVWSHQWHYGSARWDAARFAADRALTAKARSSPTPAGLLAHALLLGTGCALMPDAVPDRAETCSAVVPAYREAFALLRQDAPLWLAFEGTWTYAYVLNQAAHHDWTAGDQTSAEQKWRTVRSHCQSEWSGLSTDLVNAPELVEECAEAAGALGLYDQLFISVDWLRDHARADENEVPFKAFAAAYRSAHPVCHGLDLERNRKFDQLVPDLARDDAERFFCYAAGLLLLDCPDMDLYGSARYEGIKRAPQMPWTAMEQGWRKASAVPSSDGDARPLTARTRTCALTGSRNFTHEGVYAELSGTGAPPSWGPAWFGDYATDPWHHNDFFTLDASGSTIGLHVEVDRHTVRHIGSGVYELTLRSRNTKLYHSAKPTFGQVVGRLRALGWEQNRVTAVELRWLDSLAANPLVFLREPPSKGTWGP